MPRHDNSRIAALSFGELEGLLERLRARAVEIGLMSAHDVESSVNFVFWGDGTGQITVQGNPRREFGGFQVPFHQAIRDAETWLTRDEQAEMNLTLGLTADGRLVE